MKLVVFIFDFYVGHALPTLHVATSLRKQGYKVVFLGIPDIEPYVANQGIPFYSILEDVYPKGTRDSPRTLTQHLSYILTNNPIDRILMELHPELLITNYFIALETLVLWYKHRIPTAIFTTFLREPWLDPASAAIESLIRLGAEAYQFLTLTQQCGCSISSLQELVNPLKRMPEIISCPKELDFPEVDRGTNVHYIEPCVREQLNIVKEFNWPVIEKDTKLIYISLGSQVVSFLEKGREYYRLFFEVIRRARNKKWFFIFSVCSHIDLYEFEPIPENVRVFPWVPQLEILKKASLSINHGGLGSIKECIYYGVPMLVFPIVADQFKNSERVKIRKVGDIGKPEPEQIIGQMEELLKKGPGTTGLKELQALFRTRQTKEYGANVMKQILSPQLNTLL